MNCLTYKKIGTRSLRLNVVGDTAAAVTVIVYFNGGFWQRPLFEHIDLGWLTAHGAALVHVEYSTCADGPLPLQFSDAEDAVRFASELCGRKVIVSGHSSGGLLACHAAWSPTISGRVAGGLLIAPELDLESEYRHIGEQWNWFASITGQSGTENVAAALRRFSPLNGIPDHLAFPIQIHHGCEDDLPIAFSRGFANQCAVKGLDVALYEYPGLGHDVPAFCANQNFMDRVLGLIGAGL
jgi:acetyl esterase/lipase